ncbi:class I SAM-dependent methyltransferase [Cohnella massiliensis]|uniref:class I SAM-dependent methyltransferase n=1 Tax=Cohnella massiliensis TaxID=1816691 RepID=UPI0009BA0E10|nr:class I SAM-dependent methyltransferase [Cohnella massiliensis]
MNKIPHESKRVWEENGVRIIDCASCEFIHIDPIPTEEQLLFFYKQRYYKDIKPFNYDAVTSELIKSTIMQVQTNQHYRSIYNQVISLLASKNASVFNMLDVGCGNDLLSLYFQQQGWETAVIEPNGDAALYLRNFGIPVYEKFANEINKLNLKELSFVNIQFVLEHIEDPISLLNKINEKMVPGGVVRICVPSDFSEGQLAYRGYYNEQLRWVVQPDHINYFTFSSLSKLLCNCGFQEVYRTTNFPLEFLLLGGLNYYADEEQQKKVSHIVHHFENAFLSTGYQDKLMKLYESLAQLGMGRSIFMFAVKR